MLTGNVDVDIDLALPWTSTSNYFCQCGSCLFDFAKWALSRLSTDDLASLRRKRIRLGEFCAGMGTGAMCLEALSRACGIPLGLLVLFAEKKPWKQEVLKGVISGCSVLGKQRPLIFGTCEELVQEVRSEDPEQPRPDVLLMGIVCTCRAV